MTRTWSRRRALHLGAVGLAGGLTGCTAFGEGDGTDRPEPFTLNSLELFNEDQEPHRLQIEVRADGETIHEQVYDLAGASGNTVTDRELAPREWVDGTVRRLTLRGQVDDQEPIDPVEVTAAKLGDCAEIIYHIQDDGSLDIEYRVPTSGTDSCTTES